MGFPLGYSELLLPKLILQFFFFLSSVRKLISWAFDIAGLDNLLLDSESPSPNPSSFIQTHHHHHHPQSVSASLIQEILPIVMYRDLIPAPISADSCAVCLHEFDSEDEVRRLSNCRHVFHRPCLDRWVEHEQSTCPMCRAALVPEEMKAAFDERIWAATAAGSFPAEFDSFSAFLIPGY